MEDKNNEIKQAIEQVVGEHVDNFLIVASNNNNGMNLQAAAGNIDILAFQMAETFSEHPEFESKIKTAKPLVSGQLDNQVKELLSRLAEHFGGADDDE